jgi:hypothetical protein
VEIWENIRKKGVIRIMSSKVQRLINIVMIIVSWLSLPVFGRKNIKRFLPAAGLIVLLEAINVLVGKKRKWWIYYNNPTSYVLGELPVTLGPFFIGSMWILKMTFGHFKRFLLLNAVINAFFAFIMVRLTERLKVAKLVRITNFQFFLYLFYKAPLLYGFQYIIEKIKKQKLKNRLFYR